MSDFLGVGNGRDAEDNTSLISIRSVKPGPDTLTKLVRRLRALTLNLLPVEVDPDSISEQPAELSHLKLCLLSGLQQETSQRPFPMLSYVLEPSLCGMQTQSSRLWRKSSESNRLRSSGS
ncbi:hypothetical protein BJ165DRAFT_1012251 [Panaeolus papilionaceus]|nr:hypothetical protein BJ165DRAFT_1012251 [Panaeolus papilionaceus]